MSSCERAFVVRVDVLSKRNLRIRSEYVVFEEPIADVDGKPRRIREEELNKGVPCSLLPIQTEM